MATKTIKPIWTPEDELMLTSLLTRKERFNKEKVGLVENWLQQHYSPLRALDISELAEILVNKPGLKELL